MPPPSRSRSRRRTTSAPAVNATPVPACRKEPAAREFGRGHDLFASGKLIWCRRCGAYGEERFRALLKPCGGNASQGMRAGQLCRLVKGEHPLRRGERLPLPVRMPLPVRG